MKKVILYASVLLMAACTANKEGTPKSETATTAEKTTVMPEMPYQLARPYMDWQIDEPQNAANLMKSLKAFEMNNMEESMKYFADSIKLGMDNLDATVSRDSLQKMFTQVRSGYKDLKIDMKDFESVISKDKKEQWVTLWYNQSWTDKNGKVDSIYCINDAKMENGKIARLEEYTRHYQVKK